MKILGFDRKNITYRVSNIKRATDKDELLWEYLCEEQGQGIIYGSTRKEVEILTEKLKSWYLNAAFYHGGMDSLKREEIQEKFMKNKIHTIVCTNAFGMGVDKENIRYVIHYSIPSSIESYYQETGRAGRDGKNSNSILFYKYSDLLNRKFLIEIKFPQKIYIVKIYEYILKQKGVNVNLNISKMSDTLFKNQLNFSLIENSLKLLEKDGYIKIIKSDKWNNIIIKKTGQENLNIDFRLLARLKEKELTRLYHMSRYVNTDKCRRKIILPYFGDFSIKTNCKHCDNCLIEID